MTAAGRIVVVGASIGGLTAAETLRQEGYDGEILLLGDERHLPYTRPPLSKQILSGHWRPEQAAIRSADQLDDLAIELHTSCTAVALDVDGRTVHTTDGSWRYDEIIIATGSGPVTPPEVPMALPLRTLDDALALRDRLLASHRVAVLGAGVLGSEVASAAIAQGVATLLLGRSGVVSFGAVGPHLSARLERLHREHGVELALRTRITEVEAKGSGMRIGCADGTTHDVDLLVALTGGVPRTAWLASARLSVSDGVLCDSEGRAAPGVSAVGDVAAWADPFTGKHLRTEHQSNAIEQAVAVATRLVHASVASAPVPLFWSEVHGVRIQAYGWFDSQTPLTSFDLEATGSEAADRVTAPSLLISNDAGSRIRGIVGWNASPREFRTGRARVDASLAPTTIS